MVGIDLKKAWYFSYVKGNSMVILKNRNYWINSEAWAMHFGLCSCFCVLSAPNTQLFVHLRIAVNVSHWNTNSVDPWATQGLGVIRPCRRNPTYNPPHTRIPSFQLILERCGCELCESVGLSGPIEKHLCVRGPMQFRPMLFCPL